jgi:hypothetical protein
MVKGRKLPHQEFLTSLIQTIKATIDVPTNVALQQPTKEGRS